MTEMLPMSTVREKNCFFQQLKSARIEFIPKLCHVLRFLDKHIPPQLSELYYSYGKKHFCGKKKKKKNESIQIIRGKNMCKIFRISLD